MPIIITHKQPPPNGSDPVSALSYIIDALAKLLEYVRGLLVLGPDVRNLRTREGERGVLFQGITVTNAAVTSFETTIPDTVTQEFTTALIVFDTASGAGRYRYDGGIPAAAALATAGLPIPASGFQFTLRGALNIRSFRVIAEGATALNLSVMLHK